MQRPITTIATLVCVLSFSGYSQAGMKDIKARAKMKISAPDSTHWKCRRVSSMSSDDFLKASSLYFQGKSFKPSLVKKIIPKNRGIIFAELIAEHGNFRKANVRGPIDGPGYEARYNMFIISGEVPKTDYFWTRESRMNYGSGLGYVTFKDGKPLFVKAKYMNPYGGKKKNSKRFKKLYILDSYPSS